MNILELISKYGSKEKALLDKEFISPVFNNTKVATYIDRIVYRFNIGSVSPGWYTLKPKDSRQAQVVSEADVSQVESYLQRLPKLRMVLINRSGIKADALVPMDNPFGFQLDTFPVLLINDVPMEFDTIIARYDGSRLWFHYIDPKTDIGKGDYLRQAYQNQIAPDTLKYPGLIFEEKAAYALRFEIDRAHRELTSEEKLKSAVEHGGGNFVSFSERSDHFRVTYMVDGKQYSSTVKKDDSMEIISAGICLNGNDSNFDLKSLIPVLKEGHRDNHYFEVFNDEDTEE